MSGSLFVRTRKPIALFRPNLVFKMPQNTFNGQAFFFAKHIGVIDFRKALCFPRIESK